MEQKELSSVAVNAESKTTVRKKITIEECKAVSKKYKYRTDFKIGDKRHYTACVRYGWLNEVCAHMKRKCPGTKHIKNDVIEAAMKCQSISHFRTSCGGMYKSAVNNGYIDEIREVLSVRSKKPNGYWLNIDNVKREALKYKTKSEFKSNNHSAYTSMCQLGLSDDLFPNDRKSNGYWTKDKILKEIQKYKSVSDFYNGSPTAYARISKYPDLRFLVDNMEREKHRPMYWTYEKCREEAHKYKFMTDFIKNASGCYSASVKLGILGEITKHMTSGYDATNCNYIWKVKGIKDLYKIGVSSCSTYKNRIKAVCHSNNIECLWSLTSKSKHPHSIEKMMLVLGDRQTELNGDGYTEFRILSQKELKTALEIMAHG